MRALALTAVTFALLLSGCGAMGDIQPPALNEPQRVLGLAAQQRGDKINIVFELPLLTTENLPLRLRDVEVYVGPDRNSVANWDEWLGQATRIKTAPARAGETVRVSASATEFSSKTITIAARAISRQGRAGQWPQPLTLAIATPLDIPTGVRSTSTGQGMLVTWSGNAPRYRVFRQTGSTPAVVVATVTEPRYLDAAIEYDTSYRYAIQALGTTDNVESDITATMTATPRDTFPPGPPTGLQAATGLKAIELSWDPSPASDFAFYRIYRSLGDAPLTRLADNVRTPSYSDPSVESGKPYRYAITAVDQTGNESNQSSIVTATAP